MPVLPNNQQQQPAQSGSGFTNLNRYLQANQTNQLGQAVGGGIQQAGQAASGSIQQAGQTFNAGADQERQRLGQAQQTAANTIQNAQTATDKDVESFHQTLGGVSKGPTGIADANALRSEAQAAQGLGQATGSNAGRYGLLQRYVGKGNANYGLGAQTLDNTLLGQTGGNQLRQARSSTAGLGQQAEQQIGAAQAQGQELQGQARQVAQNVNQQLQGAVTGYDTTIQGKLTQQEHGYQDVLNKLTAAPTNQSINIDQNYLNQLKAASGGVLDANKNFYNADLSPYLALDKTYDNKAAAQSADDLAKIQALQKLGGNYLAGTSAADLISSYTSDPTLVGKYATQGLTVNNPNDLNNALKAAANQYNSALSSDNSQISNIRTNGVANPGLNGQARSDAQASDLLGNQFDYLLGQASGPMYGQSNPNATSFFTSAADKLLNTNSADVGSLKSQLSPDQYQSIAKQFAEANPDTYLQGNGVTKLGDVLRQYSLNADAVKAAQDQLASEDTKFNKFRVLNPTAVSANPILGQQIS